MSQGQTAPRPDRGEKPTTQNTTEHTLTELRDTFTSLGLLPHCDFAALPEVDHAFLAPPPEQDHTPTLTALWHFCIRTSPAWEPADVEDHYGAVIAFDTLASYYKSLRSRLHPLPEPLDTAFLLSNALSTHVPIPEPLTFDTADLNLTPTDAESTIPACKITLTTDSDTPPTDATRPTEILPTDETHTDTSWRTVLQSLPGVLELAKRVFALPAQSINTLTATFSIPEIDITPEHYLWDVRTTHSLIDPN